MRQPAVYIMASGRNGTIYTGVTANLARRVYEHREGLVPGFTSRYGCKLLVWYEFYPIMPEAIGREKQIKGGSRAKKLMLIEAMNPVWRTCMAILREHHRHCEPQAKQPRGSWTLSLVRWVRWPWVASPRSQ